MNLVVQAIGLAGFGLLLVATRRRTRRGVLLCDTAGSIVVVAHWLLLGRPVAAAMFAAGAVTNLMALKLDDRRWRAAYLAWYPAMAALAAASWRGPVDVFALVGSLLGVAGKQQRSLSRLRVVLGASASVWGVYGWIGGSIGQVAFSTLYVAGHAHRLFVERRSAQGVAAP